MSFTKKIVGARMGGNSKELGHFDSTWAFSFHGILLNTAIAQRKGPCQGFELVEKIEPA
jgi:hypothetical protein